MPALADPLRPRRAGTSPSASKSHTMKPRMVRRLTSDAAHQQRRAIRPGRRLGGVVPGDQAAHRHARELVEQRQHRLEHRPADVLPVDVDAIRAGGAQRLGEVGGAVIDAGIEAELVHRRRRTSPWPPAMPTARQPLIFAIWPTTEPTGAGRRGHHQRLAGLRPADLEQADVGGHARHAEHAERGRDRRRAPGSTLRASPAVEQRRIPASRRSRRTKSPGAKPSEVASRPPRPTVPPTITSPIRDRRGVRRRVAHAPAHVGVERQIDGPAAAPGRGPAPAPAPPPAGSWPRTADPAAARPERSDG